MSIYISYVCVSLYRALLPCYVSTSVCALYVCIVSLCVSLYATLLLNAPYVL
jgi:hypothetical protein